MKALSPAPVEMLKDISGQITDSVSLLEFIYKNTTNGCDTESAMCCLIRSMLKTIDRADEYILMLENNLTQ